MVLPSVLSLGSSGETVTTAVRSCGFALGHRVTQNSSSALLGFSYSFEPSGQIAAETDTPSSSSTPVDYTYDYQGELTQSTPGTGAAQTSSNDASGNLTTLPTGASGTYDDASELTSSTLSGATIDYDYDADCNRTQASIGGATTASGTYNGADELTSYSNTEADMTAASYDADGLRVAASTTPSGGSSSTQHFVWNESGTSPATADGFNQCLHLRTGVNAYRAGESLVRRY